MRRLLLVLVLALPVLVHAAGEECMPSVACQRVQLPSGNHPPATCRVGEIFIDTDETDDTNCTTTHDNSLCLCVAANTWVQLDNN